MVIGDYFFSIQWLAFRLDIIGTILIFVTALLVVFTAVYPQSLGGFSASFAGLALSYAITVCGNTSG